MATAVLACSNSRGADKPADSTASRADGVNIHRERDYALDPGAAPFHLVLDAAGPNVDSLAVTLKITDPNRKSVYDRTWSSAGYLECECDDSQRPAQLPGLRADAQRYLETFFDSAFIAAAPDTGRYWEQADHRMSVLMQVVPQLWDPTRVKDTSAVLDSIGAEKPTSFDALADQIRTGILKRPAIIYRTSLEGYCIAAWAPEAARVLDVLCGP